MKLRKALPADAAVVTDFNVKLAWETERLRLDPKTVARGVKALLRDEAKGIYFVAELEGEIAGQLMITYEWSDWRNGMIWWLQSVYVPEKFRGRGVFTALFGHLTKLAAKKKGVWSLRLYMEKHNERARKAYHKLGMREMDYEVFEFAISEVALAKERQKKA